MLLVHTEDYQGTVNESEVENVISAAVIRSRPTKAEGSVGASFQNAQGNKVTGDSVNKATTFTVKGGDSTLASDPQSWPGSVKPPSQWAVIGRSKLTSIVEWLPDDLRGRVMTLWPKVPVPPAIWELQDTRRRTIPARRSKPNSFSGRRPWTDRQEGPEVRCNSSAAPPRHPS